jgi:hypothetical protein
MDALATFLLQVDPVTVQSEAFVGKAHRAVLAEVSARAWRPSPAIPLDFEEITGWEKRHPKYTPTPRPKVAPAPNGFTPEQMRAATVALANNKRKAS